MQPRRKDVLQKLAQHRQTLYERYGVASLYLFGSVARDDASQDSDVDLLVKFERPVGLFEFIEVQQYLEAVLECRVDLGTKQSLKPILEKQVMKEAILVR